MDGTPPPSGQGGIPLEHDWQAADVQSASHFRCPEPRLAGLAAAMALACPGRHLQPRITGSERGRRLAAYCRNIAGRGGRERRVTAPGRAALGRPSWHCLCQR